MTPDTEEPWTNKLPELLKAGCAALGGIACVWFVIVGPTWNERGFGLVGVAIGVWSSVYFVNRLTGRW